MIDSLKNIYNTAKDFAKIDLNPPFSIDIGSRSIEIIQIQKYGNFYIKAYSRSVLPKDIIKEGKIFKHNKFQNWLLSTLAKTQGQTIANNRLIFTIPESRIYFQNFKVSDGLELEEDLDTSFIMKQARKELPLEPERLCYDYEIINDRGSGNKRVLFIGAEKEIVNSYVKSFTEVGLKPESLCLSSLATNTLIENNSEDSYLLADIGSQNTNITIFSSESAPQLSSTNHIAGEDMAKKLAEKMNFSFEKAENKIISKGIGENADSDIKEVLLKKIDEIIDEIKEAKSYYELKEGNVTNKIILTGGSSQTPGLVSYIDQNISVSVEKLFIPDNFKWPKEEPFNSEFYIQALGMSKYSTIHNKEIDLNPLKNIPSEKLEPSIRDNPKLVDELGRLVWLRFLFVSHFWVMTILTTLIILFALFFILSQFAGIAPLRLIFRLT